MLGLIDADIVAHRVGFTTENDEEWIAKVRCDEMIEGMLHETGATEFQLWLSDSLENNFRLQICPEYKANRLAKPKPKWHEIIKEHLIIVWGARIAYNQEADDALGIGQDKVNIDNDTGTVICSIDKDLLQIPGNHYNFVKEEYVYITPGEGLTNFYRQLLIGDPGDNIPGCPGIGVVKAGQALNELGSERELFNRVVELYRKALPELKREDLNIRILQTGQLLKIRQKEDEKLWQFPTSLKSTPTEDFKPLSTPQKPV